ncbi:MAG TPA: hypothetical protein PLM27_15045, partial [Chitinophagales bacterium]|nr:hypothetical protein [Chitinophagales bacterium]
MRNIQLFFLALIPGFLFSQNYIKYHNLVNEAEFDMDNSRWESAKHKLIEAFKIADPLPVDLFMLPKCYCVLGEKKKAEKHLIKAASRSLNLPIERWARYDSIFYRKCFNNEEFISLRNKMDSINSVLIGKWESSEKIKAVRDTFKNFFNIDQQYRSQLTDQHCRDRTDVSPECLEFRNQWMLSDSLL